MARGSCRGNVPRAAPVLALLALALSSQLAPATVWARTSDSLHGSNAVRRRALLEDTAPRAAHSPSLDSSLDGKGRSVSSDNSSSSSSSSSSDDANPRSSTHAPTSPAPAQQGGGGADSSLLTLTRVRSPAPYPVRLVGQLRNGCTAFLAGPCHVVTVAHCVYDPERRIWWPGLEFSAGRNGAGDWQPEGSVTWLAAEVPDGWKRRGRSGGGGGGGGDGGGEGDGSVDGEGGASAAAEWSSAAAKAERYDVAVVVLAEPLGRRLGWMDVGCGGGGSGSDSGSDGGGGGGCAPGPSSAGPSRGGGGMAWVQVAGYPDNRPNGTLWTQRCRLRIPRLPPPPGPALLPGTSPAPVADEGAATNNNSSPEARMLTTYHDCDTRGGNSGSPLWAVPAPDDGHSFTSFEQQQQRRRRPRVLAMHVAGESRRRWDGEGEGERWLDAGAAAWVRAAIARHSDC